jgi:hypothetical protein
MVRVDINTEFSTVGGRGKWVRFTFRFGRCWRYDMLV